MFKKFFTCALLGVCLTLGAGDALAKDVIKMGLGDPIDSGSGEYGKKFKEIVEAETNGKVTVELFPNSSLGDETEMLQNVRRGSLDMCVIGIGNAVPFVSGLATLTLPYLMENDEAVVKATTGEMFDFFNNMSIEKGGIRILGYAYANYRYLTNSKRPVKNINDIKGLKIRVPNNPVFVDTYSAWGANPIPMAWAETFTALQQGVVDGQDNPYVVNATMKFQEVQDYLTEVHYQYSLLPCFIGEKNFQSYPADLQQIVLDASLAAQMHVLDWENENAAKARAVMEAGGVEVFELEDEQVWKQIAIDEIWPKNYEFVGGKEVVDKVVEALK